MAMREQTSAYMDASPEQVFELVIDPWKLPSWNRAITEVVEAPKRLEAGSTWKIRLHALSRSWVSKSQVSELDPAAGTFAYRSQTDDGNLSYADWEWLVQRDLEVTKVTVTVELHPVTFWRKHVQIKIRRRALRKEMANSLSALSEAVGS
jgi:uncharacterized protein YndB with AHSA1/START domain